MGKKKEKSLKLSPKHGVNPTIMHCFICGKDTGLALLGKLKNNEEAPKHMTNPHELCEDCKKQIDAGNKFFLEVKGNSDNDHPERTGRLVCIRGEALPDVKSPISYMEHSVFEKMFGKFMEDK